MMQRDKRWESVYASVKTYERTSEDLEFDIRKDCLAFEIRVWYLGTMIKSQILVDEESLKDSYFNIYKYVLDEMVEKIDKAMEERECMEETATT